MAFIEMQFPNLETCDQDLCLLKKMNYLSPNMDAYPTRKEFKGSKLTCSPKVLELTMIGENYDSDIVLI